MQKIALKVLRFLMIILMVNVAGTLLIQTVGRIVGLPLSWTNEFACYNFVWLVFIGSAYVMNDNAHISISYFYNKFPKSIRIILFYLKYIIMIASMIILLKPAFYYAKSGYLMKSAALHIPMLFVDGVVFVSFTLLIIVCVIQVLQGYQKQVKEQKK